MRGLPDLYRQQFKTTFASFVQYRAEIFIWMIGHVLEPLVYLVVWSVVTHSTGGRVGGFSAGDFAAYFIVMMLVNHVTYTWVMWEFEYRVRHGSLSFALLRPVHPIHTDIVENISSKLITLPVMALAAVLLAFLFRPVFHAVPWCLVAFVPAVILAFLVRFLIEWTLGFPVELLLGRLTPLQALTGLAAQVVWLGLALVIMKTVWHAGLRIYSAVGA
jgi:ABC-2 type transport system permease protein